MSQFQTVQSGRGPPRFKLVTSIKTDYSPTEIKKYESTRTGMSVVAVSRESPKVLGFFALATEIFDDSGAPHTLEHLCFMGSRNYRFKGILDKFATRAYSTTNAWTATDHTAYTLDTAGWEGFAQILPVYLEHILLPILTDSGCYTEVHHVDGKGHDAGVVYSEMQGVQNTQESLMMLEANRLLYPPGNGFRSETGGMMENLRVLTADRIREFHKEMYQPKNMCVVIIGNVDEQEMLEILDKFEDTVVNDVPKLEDPWKRPWIDSSSSPVPPLKENIVKTVTFPEKDESMGEILVAFLGPDCRDAIAMAALETLGTYLAGSSVSILEKKMVEIPKPIASGAVFYAEERPDTVVWLQLTSVPTKTLASAEKKLFEVLRETANEPLEFEYLKECLRRAKRQRKFSVEGYGNYFTTPVIADFMFGDKDGEGLRKLSNLSEYDELEKWSEQDWKDFFTKWISENKHISILGKPSAKMSKKLEKDEKARVKAQVDKLGEEGLKKLQERLDAAKRENDPEIPQDVLRQVTVPAVESIKFITTETGRAGLALAEGAPSSNIQRRLKEDFPSKDLPLYMHFEHVPSNFVHVNVILSTDSVPVELRPLLNVYIDNFFSSPIKDRDGNRIEYNKVVELLEKDTVKYEMTTAIYMDAPECVRIRFQVEIDKYGTAIEWIKTMLWDIIFDIQRLEIHVKKTLSDLPDEKRQGNDMAWSAAAIALYAPESLGHSLNTLGKGFHLKRYRKLLKDNPDKAISQMTKLRDALCSLENMRILVIGDLNKLEHPVSQWESFISGRNSSGRVVPIDKRKDRLTEVGRKPKDLVYVIPMPTLDSSFSVHATVGPSSMADPNIPALLLAVSYMDAVEGPLWKALRGSGLAYGCGFSKNVDAGLLLFSIYRSPDAHAAFFAAKECLTGYIDGTTKFDEFDLQGAISSVVLSFADAEPSMSLASTVSFINQVILGVPKDYNSVLLKQIREVTVDDIRRVMREVMLPVFEPHSSISIITTAPVNSETLVKNFKEKGFPAQVQELSFFEPKKQPGDGDDDDGDEAEDDDDDDDEEEEEDEEDEDDNEEEDEDENEEDGGQSDKDAASKSKAKA